jgi:hypothetical protein
MLKKIVFAAALVVGFVTSFNFASTSSRTRVDVVAPALACTDPSPWCDLGKKLP